MCIRDRHIACADLEAVALVHEDVDVRRIGDLSYDRQTGCFVCLVQQLQALSLQTLEGVRGRARLPRAAAENGRAVRLNVLGNVDDCLLYTSCCQDGQRGHHLHLLS